MPDPSPTPLLLVLLAFQRGWLSRERVLEATAMWMQTPGMDVGKLLVDAKYLDEGKREELAKLIGEWEATLGQGGATTVTPSLRETLIALRRASPAEAGAAGEGGPKPAVKYELGAELGRGGVGRVVEATDKELGRKVALKLMLEDSAADLLDRFRWEARITGRLDHPNVVTVHEVGTLSGTREVFFCMKRIVGKDLGWAIAEGQPVRRLVEAVRDACRAMAYAHSLGVIHRDLKPANIMVGDFGEVLVVDWGLARLIGEEDRPSQLRKVPSHVARPGRIAKQEETSNLTLEGDILGTPAYMPPEQAMGWLSAIDERSDVYALGATLYEVLTGQPPFDTGTPHEVIANVVKGKFPRPSEVRPCPPELEAICLKALAYQSTGRYASAKALQADLDAWLEGATENERRQRLAEERLAAGKAALARWRDLAARAKTAEAMARQAAEAAKSYAPFEEYRAIYRLQDEASQLEVESGEALADADDAFDGALSLVPDHREARRLKAEVHWERFLEAEARQDLAAEILARRRVEQFNDGEFDARLRGDGALEVGARAYPCRCLLDGRAVTASELQVHGFHPWSGRRMDGEATDTFAEADAWPPIRLKVHSWSCKPEPFWPGADVWAWKFEEIHRLMMPVTPEGSAAGKAPPPAILDRVFGASPFRPRGPGIHLGRTPVAKRPWPRGQWLLLVVADGREPQRVPIEVRRGEDTVVDATLFFPAEIPPGLFPVLGGTFESLKEAGTVELYRTMIELDDAFVARFPVTCAEYCAWLNELDREDPGLARERAPRAAERSGWCWPRSARGWVVPTAAWLAAAPDGERARAARLEGSSTDWEEGWPVFGTSWVDATSYLRRLSEKTGWLYALPTLPLRERASRGDGHRRYPWGNFGVGSIASTNQSREGDQHPSPVDSFPLDESPWGIRGVAGNSVDRTLSDAGPSYRNWRSLRGGAWSRPAAVGRTSFHSGGPIRGTAPYVGFRASAAVRLSGPGAPAGER